jgi:hypothetical protein
MKSLPLYLFGAALLVSTSCSSNSDDTPAVNLQAPTDVAVERTGLNEVTLTWTDNSEGEEGYSIQMRRADTGSYQEVGKAAANATSYVITGLEQGYNYYIGTHAYSGDAVTRTISVLFKMENLAAMPQVSISGTVASGKNCISVEYDLSGIDGVTAEYGLCADVTANPTTDSKVVIAGPAQDASGHVFQVIPNVALTEGSKYYVRAYVKTAVGTYYSDSKEVTLGDAPAAITLEWTKLSFSSLPSDIEVYETTSNLNGDKFHAWYAIADVSGDVELRVNVPSSTATIDDQASSFNGDCYVMINGGYFYNGRHTGIAVVNSAVTGSLSSVRGSLRTGEDEYDSMYYVTRGLFGVNASGKPYACWVGTFSGDKTLFTEIPLPTVKGENKYGNSTSTLADYTVSDWSPKYALSAGPLLLKDGVIPFDFTTTSKGGEYYLSNYEVLPYDIYGPSVTPDRTAVGYRADGKVILFICDGRITASDGATLVELAQIMKGLGCVGAVNFDGGGSTGMVVSGQHLNDQTGGNRPVVSTIGFFKK